MRKKNKLYCDYCGKFILEDNKMKEKADKLWSEGTRLNCAYRCKECFKK